MTKNVQTILVFSLLEIRKDSHSNIREHFSAIKYAHDIDICGGHCLTTQARHTNFEPKEDRLTGA
jgi:hypothetical protein